MYFIKLASKLAASQASGGPGYGGPQQGGYSAQQSQTGQKPGGYVSKGNPQHPCVSSDKLSELTRCSLAKHNINHTLAPIRASLGSIPLRRKEISSILHRRKVASSILNSSKEVASIILNSNKVASSTVSNMADLPKKPPLNRLKRTKIFFGLPSKRNSCTT